MAVWGLPRGEEVSQSEAAEEDDVVGTMGLGTTDSL